MLLTIATTTAAQSIPNRKLYVQANAIPLEEALTQISQDAHFNFSYNPDYLPTDSLVDLHLGMETVRDALRELLGNSISYTSSGNYLVLKPNNNRGKGGEGIAVSGQIIDQQTGKPLAYATIYDTEHNTTTLTDGNGNFSLIASSDEAFLGLGVSRKNFTDTIIVV